MIKDCLDIVYKVKKFGTKHSERLTDKTRYVIRLKNGCPIE